MDENLDEINDRNLEESSNQTENKVSNFSFVFHFCLTLKAYLMMAKRTLIDCSCLYDSLHS